MNINRMIFTRRNSRWSPTTPRMPEPVWLAVLGGAGFAVFCVALIGIVL